MLKTQFVHQNQNDEDSIYELSRQCSKNFIPKWNILKIKPPNVDSLKT